MKALFLDRDGVVNKERGDYTWTIDHFEFTRNLFPFLRSIRKSGYEIIIVTNQGGIDKGLYTKSDVEKLHTWMTEKLKDEEIDILDIYYCPHHSDFQKCLCRKPAPLLFEKALATYNIEGKNSFMIGDSQRDIEGASTAEIAGFKIDSNPDWSLLTIPGLHI